LDTCKPEFNTDFSAIFKDNKSEISKLKNGYYIDSSKDKIVLDNWINALNLRCIEKWKIGMFGSIYFVGCVLSNLILAPMGDTVGRILLI